jgi:hypothetical protein
LTRKSRCAEEQSPERENLHGTFRRLMKGGGFLFSWCVTKNINQKKEKPKSENTYRTRVVCGINRRSLGTDPREWLLPDGHHGISPGRIRKNQNARLF